MGTMHDLSHKLEPGMTVTPGLPPPRFERVWRIPEQMANVTYYSFSSHLGTHMDAPLHYYADGASLDELDFRRFKGDGFVVPIPGTPRRPITVDDLAPYRDDLAAARFALLSTGWARHFGTPEYREHPYLEVDAAQLLVEIGITCVILDTMTPDLPLAANPDRKNGPVHSTLLGNDVLIVENAASMADVEGRRVTVMAFPMRIERSDGAPIRLVVETHD
jgi:kynurenine formamidase